jgi:hypothetical protein
MGGNIGREHLMLSPNLQAAALSPNRDTRVGASFVPALMAGKSEAIMQEWKRLVGDPSYQPENLDGVWPVQIGKYLEPFVLDWEERKSGPLDRRGEWVQNPNRNWLGCTLDAYRASTSTVLDCKVVGQWRKLDEVISYYTPQMLVQRDCTGAENASLLIVHGGSEPVEYPVTWPVGYEADVWTRLDGFWDCVESLTPPCELPELLAPVPAVKTYDMGTSNAWVSNAATWALNKSAAKDFDAASKELKALVPADAIKCFGGGITVSRSKAGSLSIKEGK